jgi:hypothetical protein
MNMQFHFDRFPTISPLRMLAKLEKIGLFRQEDRNHGQ